MQSLSPILVAAQEGWLTEQCAKANIPYLLIHFPRSRSWKARLYENRAFAGELLREVKARNWMPILVQGNDHLEGLLAYEVAKSAKIPGVIFLRSSETTKQDFFKYDCDCFSIIYAVGKDLFEKVRSWVPQAEVKMLSDGFNESDFYPPKAKVELFPYNILVAGSESHYKGWADLAVAVDLLERDDSFPALTFDFTGVPPDPKLNNLHLSRVRRAKFNFIGRSQKFAELVRQYDLVIHPSREESFGIAAMEILAAGVPLLCSRTGAIEDVRMAHEWLFQPKNPEELASRLGFLHDHWAEIVSDIAICQAQIRGKFMMDQLAGNIARDLRALSSSIPLTRD